MPPILNFCFVQVLHNDAINQYQKYLIENNNKFDLELFNKILIDSGINQVKIQNDNEIKIKRNNRF